MRITKVYTRTGDAGKTRLAGGQQVWKDSLRVEAYGAVDELNASVGVVRVINADMKEESPAAQQLEGELRWVQNKLFDVGSILATAPGQTFKNMPQVVAQDVLRLEKTDGSLSKGSRAAQRVHLAGWRKSVGFSSSSQDHLPPGRTGMHSSIKSGAGRSDDHQVPQPTERCAVRLGSLGGKDAAGTGVFMGAGCPGQEKLERVLKHNLPEA